ncbi:MAG: hypothetical protein EA383_17580 [Spirochaetaceae bacterium]|nr:MAG: hypothetical protein EA383_17580 [Spirochaetaceae bacterium]
MRHTRKYLAPLCAILTAVLLTAGCGWQMFENIQVKANPTYQVPGGTGRQLIADLELFEQIETDLAAEFDDTSRYRNDPYTFRGRITPISVNVDDFLDETGINQTIEIDDVTFGGVDVGAIGIPGVQTDVLVVTGDDEGSVALPGIQLPDITGFVEATIGTGFLTITIGDSDKQLPEGTYELGVTVTSILTEPDDSSFINFPLQLVTVEDGVIQEDVSLAGLEIENAGEIEVSFTLDWDVDGSESDIPVDIQFSIDEFSELVVDVGTNFLDGFDIDSVAIEKDIRRQVREIEIDTAKSDIVLRVTADLPRDLTITLGSNELFTGSGEQSGVVEAGLAGEQTLTFDIDNSNPIIFQDPDAAVDPEAIESFDINVSTTFTGYDEGTGHLTLTNVSTSESINASLTNTSIDVALEIESVTLRDINEFFTDFDEGLDADALSFLDELPDWFNFSSVPLRFGIQGSVADGDPPTLDLTFTGYNAAEEGDVVGDPVTITGVQIGDPDLSTGDLAPLLNERPARIDIDISVTDGGSELTLSSVDTLEVVIEIDLVFAFAVDTGGGGSPANLLEQFLDDEAFVIEDDLLDRESADDLQDILSNLESARLFVTIENSSGLDGLSFSIIQPGPDGWTLAEGNLDGDLVIELTSEDIRKIETTYPFTPEFRLFIAETVGDPYELNYDGEIAMGLRLELTADIDYTFTVFGEDN